MRNYARRVDANQAEIFGVWRDLGVLVTDTSHIGGGFPDCMLAYGGRLYLAEIKDGSKPPSAQRLTPAQEVFHRQHEAHGVRVATIRTIDDALALIGARRGA